MELIICYLLKYSDPNLNSVKMRIILTKLWILVNCSKSYFQLFRVQTYYVCMKQQDLSNFVFLKSTKIQTVASQNWCTPRILTIFLKKEVADDLSHNLCIPRHHQSCLLDPTTSKETASVKMDAFSHVKFLNFFQWHICTSLYWVCLYCFLSKKASREKLTLLTFHYKVE